MKGFLALISMIFVAAKEKENCWKEAYGINERSYLDRFYLTYNVR
jgi:hypothetical protein